MEVTRLRAKSISKWAILLCLFVFIPPSHGINLGLIAGDFKSRPSPLLVRKVSHHSPVIINVNPGLPKLPGIASLPPKPSLKLPNLPGLASLPPVPVPKLPAKPPPILFKSSKLRRSPLTPPLPLLPPHLLPPFILPPAIPHMPLLPIIPPVIPPLLPIIPPPLLGTPRTLLPPFHPLKIPIFGQSPLDKTLGTIRLPVTDREIRRKIFSNLLDLKIKGSLTTPEFLRFKKLLLK